MPVCADVIGVSVVLDLRVVNVFVDVDAVVVIDDFVVNGDWVT